jgi:peptidoglycan hydrolase-like protein with peptidoglycan-binding domain
MTATISGYVAANGRFGIGDEGEHVELTQQALLMTGAELVVDGDFGPITEAAVKAFQAKERLQPVGYVGPKTAAALDAVLNGELPLPPSKPGGAPPWLATMRAITGTKEIPGAKNSPIIMSWSGEIARAYRS